MAFYPDAVDIRAEERLLNEPLYQKARASVVSYIERLQNVRTPEQYVELHRELLVDFGARQAASDEVLPAAKDAARAKIAELSRQHPKPIQLLREQQAILERVERQELVSRAMQHTLRQIGDGIAWKALHYDRRAITLLGEGERVGRLAEGVGFDAEVTELGRLWEEEGVFAIHNDLTNCLRHADLTAIRPTESQLDVTLIEVKVSDTRKDTPQLRRQQQAIEALRDPNRFHYLPVRYRTFLANLPGLINRAKRRGHAWMRPTPSLLLSAVDYRTCAGRESELLTPRIAEMRSTVGWFARPGETLDWTASLRRMRDRRTSFSSLAPLTIFPVPPEDVADLIMGFLDLSMNLNLDMLARSLTRGGIRVRVARPPESEMLFLEASRGRAGVLVPPFLREQMMMELTTPYTVWRALDAVVAAVGAQSRTADYSKLVVFGDEARVWS